MPRHRESFHLKIFQNQELKMPPRRAVPPIFCRIVFKVKFTLVKRSFQCWDLLSNLEITYWQLFCLFKPVNSPIKSKSSTQNKTSLFLFSQNLHCWSFQAPRKKIDFSKFYPPISWDNLRIEVWCFILELSSIKRANLNGFKYDKKYKYSILNSSNKFLHKRF